MSGERPSAQIEASSARTSGAGARTSHPILARGASGLRHLRWAREVLGTLRGFRDLDAHLSVVQRGALDLEVERAAAVVAELSAAVKPYRDFLERTRTGARGRLRAAAHCADGGDGLAAPPSEASGAAMVAAAEAHHEAVIEPERRRLHDALERAIDAARDGLRAMDERLEGAFSPAFVAALYPELTADASRVRDDGDPDDDAAG